MAGERSMLDFFSVTACIFDISIELTPPSLRATSPIAHSCAEEEVNTFGRFFGEGLEYTRTIPSNYRLNRR